MSTLLTIGTYAALTKYRHKYTEEKIKQSILAEHSVKKSQNPQEKQQFVTTTTTFTPALKKPQAFKGINVNCEKDREQISFQGGLSDFMFSPVKNLMIVDGAITTERLATSRSIQDFLGYSIKEGSFWLFMYGVGGKIQEYLEKKADSKHNKNIALDARIIESAELKNAFKDNSLQVGLQEFSKCGIVILHSSLLSILVVIFA